MATAISTRSLDFANGNLRVFSRLLLAAVLLLPSSALAFCLPSAEFDAWLAQKHGELPAYSGVTAGGRLKVYESQGGRTWTAAIEIEAEGYTCLLSVGANWNEAPKGPRA